MPQFIELSLFLPQNARSSEGSLHGIEQILLPERLGKKLSSSRLHGLDRHWNIGVSREENNGNICSAFFQFVLKIQPADTGKPHIQNQATRIFTPLNR